MHGKNALNFDIKIERQIKKYLKKTFKNLNIDKNTQKILVNKLQEIYESLVRQISSAYHKSNNWFNDMANKVHNNLQVSVKEIKYSQDMMDQCSQQTKNFQNEIKEHLDNVHKLHKSNLVNLDNLKLPSFINEMGYKKTLNKKKTVIMPSNNELKFHKMAKKLFFGMNKLYRHSKHNWQNIMTNFNKQIVDTENFMTQNKMLGNVIRGIKKQFK